MSYSNFTIKDIQDCFQVQIFENLGLFENIEKRIAGPMLRETLYENIPLAVSINTEKARSELIIAPILVELRKLFDRKISLFSGIEFHVDKEKNLTDYCDFIISHSPEQLFLKSPVIAIVEAKNENIMGGLGQCMAEMVAARIFNEKEGIMLPKIYGVITSGSLWKFLKLDGNIFQIDLDDYGIKELECILGILSAMVEQNA